MRWSAKKKPEQYDIRIVERFLFLPKKLKYKNKLEVRWLEKVKIRQQYKYYTGGLLEGIIPEWTDLEFID